MSLLSHYAGALHGAPPPASHAPAAPGAPRRPCGRCRAADAVAVVRAEAVCRLCLERSVYGKARSALARCAAAGLPVALVCAGSHGGRALLDVVLRATHVGRKRRVFADVVALVVDGGDVVAGVAAAGGPTAAASTDVARAAARRCALAEPLRCGFPVVYVPLCALFADGGVAACVAVASAWTPDAAGTPTPPPGNGAPVDDPSVCAAIDAAVRAVDAALASPVALAAAARARSFFAALRTADARCDALESLVHRAAVEAAAAVGVAAVLVPDTADDAARRTLCALAAGRGGALPLDAAPTDARHARGVGGRGRAAAAVAVVPVPPCAWARDAAGLVDAPALPPGARPSAAPGCRGLLIARPLLELEAAEAALYCRVRGLPVDGGAPGLGAPALLTLPGDAAGRTCAGVTDALLSGLQAAFVNTVHTVVRTARKLRLQGSGGDEDDDDDDDGPLLCAFCFAVLPPAAAAAAAQLESGAAPPVLCRGCRTTLPPGIDLPL